MSESTRQKLLEVAEKLIAKNGIGNTSLRQIVKEAGVNIAAVNYHFGSKDDLMIAVYQQHFIPVNDERIRRLDNLEAEANGKTIPLEQLIDAFLIPVFEGKLRDKDKRAHNVLLFSRLHTEGPELRMKIFSSFSHVLIRFVQAFSSALPNLSPAEIFFRMKCSMGILMTLAMEPPFPKHAMPLQIELEPEHLAASLIAYAAAGFRSIPDPKPNQGDTE